MKLSGNLPYRHLNVTDIDSLDSKWREEFEREIAENNFVRGGKSLALLGDGAVTAHEQWCACLLLAGLKAFMTDPVEIVRRLRGQYIPRDTEETKAQFDEAEAIFIRQFFGPTIDRSEDTALLAWYMDQAIQDGCMIVIATDRDEDTTGYYQDDQIAAIIDNAFEAIRGKTTRKNNKPRNQ